MGNEEADAEAKAASTMHRGKGAGSTSPADILLNKHVMPSPVRKWIVHATPKANTGRPLDVLALPFRFQSGQMGTLARSPRMQFCLPLSFLFFLLPLFVVWPLELGLGTHNPRFVAWPLELGLGTGNPRFVAWLLGVRDSDFVPLCWGPLMILLPLVVVLPFLVLVCTWFF